MDSLATTNAPTLNRRPSRVAAVLLGIAVLSIVWSFFIPHVLWRVPFAIIAAWGLWRRRRWAYILTLITGVIWTGTFMLLLPFLIVANPLVIWVSWLLWLVPTGLVLAACVVTSKKAGRDERAEWRLAG